MRIALATVLVLAACSSKKAEDTGPSCEQVVDAILELTKSQLQGHGTVDMKSQRQPMVDECAKRNLTVEQKKCMVAAKTLDALAACTPAAPAK